MGAEGTVAGILNSTAPQTSIMSFVALKKRLPWRCYKKPSKEEKNHLKGIYKGLSKDSKKRIKALIDERKQGEKDLMNYYKRHGYCHEYSNYLYCKKHKFFGSDWDSLLNSAACGFR